MARDSDPGWFKPDVNGPYSWGNGPQPKDKCSCKRAAKLVARGKVRPAARTFVYGWKHRLGVI